MDVGTGLLLRLAISLSNIRFLMRNGKNLQVRGRVKAMSSFNFFKKKLTTT